MIKTIGCLSYTPLGYGTPQIQYLLTDLASLYRVSVPVGVFAPRLQSYPDLDEQFPEFFIHHFWPIDEHKAALQTAVPELVQYVREHRLSRIGVYGAGTHTKILLEIWERNQGPGISTLITSEPPPYRNLMGIPVVSLTEIAAGSLDLIILSSHRFEEEMAELLRSSKPLQPFAAIYNGRLSNYPEGRLPTSARLAPLEYEDFRSQSAARWLDSFRPDLLVCTHSIYFEAILKARHQPRRILYYAFEMPGGSDGHPFKSAYWNEHRDLASRISLMLFPESARRRYYQQVFRWEDVPSQVVLNARPLTLSSPLPPDQRNGRVLIQGALGADKNFIDYLTQRPTNTPHIDIYGLLQSGDRGRTILVDPALSKKNGFTYCGFVDNKTIAQRRREYAFSFVSWNPTSFDALHACPNKFFEAIADGVPPLAAPHPQCREIIEKYDCGILLRDWSLTAFLDGLRQADEIYHSSRYLELVANCHSAHAEALSWERQFARIRRRLPKQPRARTGFRRARFVLLDHSLHSETGHFYHYAEHVLEGAASLGRETLAGVNRACGVTLEHAESVYPVYWYDFWGQNVSCPDVPRNAPAASAAFVEHSRFILKRAGIGPSDDIFVPNISDTDLDALARCLTDDIKSLEGPVWHLFLRRDLPEEPEVRVTAMQRLANWGGLRRVRFYTDTKELAEQHEQASGLPVTILPIPIAARPVRATRQRGRGPLRVAYLGDARVEKGFAMLPGIVRACLPAVQAGQIVFDIQTTGSNADPLCGHAAAELQGLYQVTGLNLLTDRLTTGDYDRILSDSDVLLALYDPSIYRRRSSHVVVEGLCRGKAVAMLRGAAPAALVPPDCPWLCTDSTDAIDLIQRLAGTVDPLKSWKPASALQAKLAAFHTGTRLAELLLGRSPIFAPSAS